MPIATLDNRSHIAIDGEVAEHFLHNLVTTDIVGLQPSELRPGALLSAQGKVMFGFLVFRTSNGFMFEVAHQDASDFVKRLKFFRLRANVNIAEPRPVLVKVIWNEPNHDGADLRDARFANLAVWRGIETVPSSVADDVWTWLRIAHAVAEPHVDYTYGEVFPHDINLDQTAGLSFSKGCYVGQEVVSRMHHRGTARWRLMVAKGEGLEQGAEVTAGAKASGALGSVGGGIAMALVRLDRIKDALNRNLPIEAAGKQISLSFPANVTYDWPAESVS
jgi:tRNA-modifying protein YgfZ